MDGGGPFGQQFLQGFFGVENLRDYTHASKTFTTNSYELKPRYKFLFHVSFTLNVQQIPALRGAISNDEIVQYSYLVKTVDLPKYNIANETLNQYNRKRIVQTKIEYDPINITFHDDGGDNSRNMWYNYFKYYYKDPSQKYLSTAEPTNGFIGKLANYQTGFSYNNRDIYDQERIGNVNDWGYIGEAYNDGTQDSSGKPPFFRDIRITGLDQHKFAQYVLINPLITNWSHDQYDYSQGNGIMTNTMQIRYETVKYFSGALSGAKPDVNVVGFADPAHYDTRKSPLARPGSTATIFGQGGLLDTAEGIMEDLESGSVLGVIGAIQKAGTAYNTFKGKNLSSIVKSEATALGKNILIGSLPGAVRTVAGTADGVFFPKQNAERQYLKNIPNQQVPPGGYNSY